MSKTRKAGLVVRAAEDAVSRYLAEFGPAVSWDEGWFTAAYVIDSGIGGTCADASWCDYFSAAREALKRSQNADLADDPRENESQWRSPPPTVVVRTCISQPRPSTCGVPDGVDFDADLEIIDEIGIQHRWLGQLTYAPGVNGVLTPYRGSSLETWMCATLMAVVRLPWVASHEALATAVIELLSDGQGVATRTVTL